MILEFTTQGYWSRVIVTVVIGFILGYYYCRVKNKGVWVKVKE